MTKKKLSALTVYRQLWPYSRPYSLAFIVSIVANLIYAAINSLFTYILKPILDKGFIAQDHLFLAWLPGLIILLFLARGLSSLIGAYATSRMSQGVILNIQKKKFSLWKTTKVAASLYLGIVIIGVGLASILEPHATVID